MTKKSVVLTSIDTASQPIPAERLKEFYVRELEVNLELARTEAQRKEAVVQLVKMQADFDALCSEFGVPKAFYTYDLKAGTMAHVNKKRKGS